MEEEDAQVAMVAKRDPRRKAKQRKSPSSSSSPQAVIHSQQQQNHIAHMYDVVLQSAHPVDVCVLGTKLAFLTKFSTRTPLSPVHFLDPVLEVQVEPDPEAYPEVGQGRDEDEDVHKEEAPLEVHQPHELVFRF